MANKTIDKPDGNEQSEQEKQQQLRTKAFRIALEMVGLFGIPAVLAVLIGGWSQAQFGWPDWTTLALLGVAFLMSWAIVFYRVRSFAREFKATKEEMEDTDSNEKQN
jgi:Na+/melibiose symporter-like transporter